MATRIKAATGTAKPSRPRSVSNGWFAPRSLVFAVYAPDEEAGEVPKAFVVVSEETTAEEIMAFVAERIAPHKQVRKVEFVEQIPKSVTGKILRRLLVERDRQPA